jgi:hypothetical protein
MGNSNVLNRAWERIDIDTALLIQFLLKISVTAHWIACIWGCIAYIEVGSFGDSLLDSPNWIGHWHATSYVEGGLNPIGWENVMSRYFLALFWAVQVSVDCARKIALPPPSHCGMGEATCNTFLAFLGRPVYHFHRVRKHSTRHYY